MTDIVVKCFAAILGLCLTCCGIADSAGSSPPETDESAIAQYLQPAVATGTSVRFSYVARCNGASGFPAIPPIHLNTPSSRLTGIDAVRSTFASDRDVTVTEGRDGVAKVSVGKVPTDFLRTRVTLLRLQRIDQYNPSKVLDALESTREFENAAKSLGIAMVPLLGVQLLQEPDEHAPHVPAVFHDVTIDQVLDLVAKTFTGIVLYGVCTTGPSPRQVLIKFI
jgi:hypothetical protein